jgi:hypothetical protein
MCDAWITSYKCYLIAYWLQVSLSPYLLHPYLMILYNPKRLSFHRLVSYPGFANVRKDLRLRLVILSFVLFLHLPLNLIRVHNRDDVQTLLTGVYKINLGNGSND